MSVLLAAVCGRTLDTRYATAVGGSEALIHPGEPGEEPRAGLRLTNPEEKLRGDQEAIAKAEIENLSGVSGGAPLSSESWVAETPLLIHNVDVSGMLSEELTLKRSLTPGYSPKMVTLTANLERKDSYFDLLLKDEKGAAQIVQVGGGDVVVVYRSPSGIESERSRAALPPGSQCPSIVFDFSRDISEIRCSQRDETGVVQETHNVVLSLLPLPVKGKIVSVATNLVRGEMHALSIIGDVRGVGVEDTL